MNNIKNKVIREIWSLFILVVIVLTLKVTIFELYIVPTGSMEKTIMTGDFLIGSRFVYGLRTPNWIGIPYTDIGIIRLFSSEVDSEELVWHRDKENRKVEVLEGEGWQFQFNGSLPFELTEGRKFDIPEGMYHRVIKGKTKLVLKIKK